MNWVIQYMDSEFLMGLLIAALFLGYCVACYLHGKATRLPIITRRKTPHINI